MSEICDDEKLTAFLIQKTRMIRWEKEKSYPWRKTATSNVNTKTTTSKPIPREDYDEGDLSLLSKKERKIVLRGTKAITNIFAKELKSIFAPTVASAKNN